MKDLIFRLKNSIKKWIVESLLKKMVVPAILTAIYFLVLGPTSLVAKIFFTQKLKKTALTSTSNWTKASGFEENLIESKNQS